MSRIPKFPGKPINQTVAFKMNVPGKLALDEMCEHYGYTRSEFLRKLIKKAYGEYQRTKEIPRG